MSGPCTDWTDLADVRECGPCDDTEKYADALIELWIPVASTVLYGLSGRQWPGECTATLRPCCPSCGASRAWHGVDGTYGWARLLGVDCGRSFLDGCHCSAPTIDLGPDGDVTAVSAVRIDGDVVDPTTYRLDGGRWLVRLEGADGTNPGWPCSQRLDRPDASGDDTFAIDITYGEALPAGAARVAALLACELAKACQGDECDLPPNVQRLSREGVDMALITPEQFEGGRTGIRYVDLWLDAVNPNRLSRRGSAVSPDTYNRGRYV